MIRWRGDRVHILMLPDPLSREISGYADLNQRSFNAEVTSTLEEKYTGQISAEARLVVLNSVLRSHDSLDVRNQTGRMVEQCCGFALWMTKPAPTKCIGDSQEWQLRCRFTSRRRANQNARQRRDNLIRVEKKIYESRGFIRDLNHRYCHITIVFTFLYNKYFTSYCCLML